MKQHFITYLRYRYSSKYQLKNDILLAFINFFKYGFYIYFILMGLFFELRIITQNFDKIDVSTRNEFIYVYINLYLSAVLIYIFIKEGYKYYKYRRFAMNHIQHFLK